MFLVMTGGCGVSLLQQVQLGAVLADHADRCVAERAAGPAPVTPLCDAARKCLAASEPIIKRDGATKKQFSDAMTACGGK